jgi:dipeptidyl aminopeptidase/acylaminoacyl peptidase
VPVADRSAGHVHGPLAIEDVLGIKYPSDLSFAPTGTRVGFLWNDGGSTDLWAVDPKDGEPRRISDGTGGVSAFSWSPSGVPAWIQRGRIIVDGRRLGIESDAEYLAWSPVADTLAIVAGHRLTLWSSGNDAVTFPVDTELGIINPGPGVAMRWSPDGRSLAVATRAAGTRGLTVLGVEDGSEIWTWRGEGFVTAFSWLSTDHLHVTIDVPPSQRDHLRVSMPSGEATVLVAERGRDVIGGAGAHAFPVAPVADPAGTRVAYTLYRDGWAHIHVLDLQTGELTQVTTGEFDDIGGGRIDVPEWSPDGRSIVFTSSRGDLSQRQLWRYSTADGECAPLTAMPGTNWGPRHDPTSDTLAFMHAGPFESPDIWLLDLAAEHPTPRQATYSMPPAWTSESIVAPEHITFESDDGAEIHADLFKPKQFDPEHRHPAVVFVHGGTIDQMRFGWSPGLPYLGPYSWHQYLVGRGYAVLSVDYRGTSGYGLDYQMALWGEMGVVDLQDCVSGGRWLKDQAWIDPDAVGIWGMSYGGYLTLSALTKAPTVFRAGISVAGVWDWDAVREQRADADVCLSETGRYRMFADHDEAAAEVARFEASPKNFADGLVDHLFVLHGTGDRKVTMDQADLLISRCVELGKPIEVMHYPGEQHVFVNRATWRDAYRRMEAFFDRHLRGQ